MSADATGTPSQRLRALGLELPPVPAAVGSYVPAIRVGDLVWTSGQLPFVNGALTVTGHVEDAVKPEGIAARFGIDGADIASATPVGTVPTTVSPEVAKGLARVAVLNALAAIAAELEGGIDAITRIVKLTGYVASVPEFFGQPAVINGASELIGEIFGAAGLHARAAVGVAALPLNAPVEIELIAEALPGQ